MSVCELVFMDLCLIKYENNFFTYQKMFINNRGISESVYCN